MTGFSPTGLSATGLTADISAGTGDVTAPVLSSPAGTNTGKFSAIGSVSTNESGGTLYYVTNTSASASSATVKAGGSQTVVSSGVQDITITGLTADTGYYNHFLHRDAAGNESAVASSVQWFTEAEAAPAGVVTITSVTVGSNAASMSYSYSDIDATGFEYTLDGGETVVSATASPQSITGLTASTPYSAAMRAVNDAGNGEWSDPYEFTTAATGDTTPPAFTVAPAVSSVTQTGANIGATIDETGSIFYVVVPNAQGTPSVAQVIAGQNAAGGAPSDSGSAINTTVLSDAITGLTAGTAFKACIVARDDEGTPNVQASVTVVGFAAEASPGVQAQNIPSSGANGAGFLYNDIAAQGAAPTDLMHYEILTLPSAGTLTVNPNSSFSFTGAPDGTYTFTYRGFLNGVSYGDYTVTLTVGGGVLVGAFKVWNGSEWIPAQVKRWNGSAWTDVTIKRCNGSEFVDV